MSKHGHSFCLKFSLSYAKLPDTVLTTVLSGYLEPLRETVLDTGYPDHINRDWICGYSFYRPREVASRFLTGVVPYRFHWLEEVPYRGKCHTEPLYILESILD